MARKRNTYAKRQREMAKKRKAQEKRERRWAKNETNTDSDGADTSLDI